MSKKRQKSGKKTAHPGATDGDGTDKINTGDWQSFPVLVHAEKPYALKYTEASLRAAAQGQRRRFNVVTRQDIDSMAADALKAKGKTKDAQLAPLWDACMQGMEDGAMTTEGYANVVLAKMKLSKAATLQRRVDEEEARKLAQQERLGLSSAASGKKTPSKGRGKSAKGKKGKGGSGDDENVPGKKKSAMKTRAEEGAHIDFIDDEPIIGPDEYWLVHGFDDEKIVDTMDKIGVPFSAIVNMTTDDDDDYEELLAASKKRLAAGHEKTGGSAAEGEDDDLPNGHQPLSQETIDQFSRLQQLPTALKHHIATAADMSSTLHNIAWLTLALGRAPEASASFDALAQLLYANLTNQKVYQIYMSSMEVADIPTEPALKAENVLNMQVYNDRMAQVAPENTTVHVLLDCLLAQVVHEVESTQQGDDCGPEGSGNGNVDSSAARQSGKAGTQGQDEDALDAFLDAELGEILVRPDADNEGDIASFEAAKNAHFTFQETVVVGHHDAIAYKFGAEQRYPYDGKRGALSVLQSSAVAREIFAAFPEVAPYTDEERQARQQQVGKFASLPSDRTKYCTTLINMEEMLARNTGTDAGLWDLSAWCVTEKLSHAAMLQAIEADMGRDGASVCSWYNPLAHSVVLAIHTPIVQPVVTKEWCHVANTRVGYSDFLAHVLPFMQSQNDPIFEDTLAYVDKLVRAEQERLDALKNPPMSPAQQQQGTTAEAAELAEGRHSVTAGSKLSRTASATRMSAKAPRGKSGKRGGGAEGSRPPTVDPANVDVDVGRASTCAGSRLLSRVGTASLDRRGTAVEEGITAPRTGYNLSGHLIKLSGRTQYMHPYDGAIVSVNDCEVVNHGVTRHWKLSRDDVSVLFRLATPPADGATNKNAGGPSEGAAQYTFGATVGEAHIAISQRNIEAMRTKGRSEHNRVVAEFNRREAERLAAEAALAEAAEVPEKAPKKSGKDRPKSRAVKIRKEEAEANNARPSTTEGANPDADKKKAKVFAPKFKPVPASKYFQVAVGLDNGTSLAFDPAGYVEITASSLHKDKNAYRLRNEAKRFVFASGVVVRVFKDKSTIAYMPDGTVYKVKAGADEWSSLSFDGFKRLFKKAATSGVDDAEAGEAENQPNKNGDDDTQTQKRGSANAVAVADESAARSGDGDGDDGCAVHEDGEGNGHKKASIGGGDDSLTNDAHGSEALVPVEPISVLKRISVPEGTEVLVREDNVVQVVSSTLNHTVEFEDGTRVSTKSVTATSSEHRIECMGLPAICAFESQLTVALAEGTFTYDFETGLFEFKRASGSVSLSVEASGSGVLEFMSGRQGIHNFNVHTATYHSVDEVGCEYSVKDMVPTAVLSDRALSLTLSQRGSPSLYVVYEDGSGEKWLREEDVSDYISAYADDTKANRHLVTALGSGATFHTFLQKTNYPNKYLQCYKESSILPDSMQECVKPESEWSHPATILHLRQLVRHQRLTDEDRSSIAKDNQQYAEWKATMTKSTLDLDVDDTRSAEEVETAENLRASMVFALSQLDEEAMTETCVELARPPEPVRAAPSEERRRVRRQSQLMVEGWKEKLHHDNSVPNYYTCEETQAIVSDLQKEVLASGFIAEPSSSSSNTASRKGSGHSASGSKPTRSKKRISKRTGTLALIQEDDEQKKDRANAAVANDDDDDDDDDAPITAKRVATTDSTDGGDGSLERGRSPKDRARSPQSTGLDHTSVDRFDDVRPPSKDRPQPLRHTLSSAEMERLAGQQQDYDPDGAPTATRQSPHEATSLADNSNSNSDSDGDGDGVVEGGVLNDSLNADHDERRERSTNGLYEDDMETIRKAFHAEGSLKKGMLVLEDHTTPENADLQENVLPSKAGDGTNAVAPSVMYPDHTDPTSPTVAQRELDRIESPEPLEPPHPVEMRSGIPSRSASRPQSNRAKPPKVLPEVRLKSADTLPASDRDVLQRSRIQEKVPLSMPTSQPLPAIGSGHDPSNGDATNSSNGEASEAANLSILPEEIAFGTLKAGCVYSLTVRIRNNANTVCPIVVSMPQQPGISLQCLADKISPGMSVKVTLQLNAQLFLGPHSTEKAIGATLSIHTPDNGGVITKAVTGEVLSLDEFEGRRLSNRNRGRGVRLVATKPKA